MTTSKIRARMASDPAVGAGNVLGALIEHGAPLDSPTLTFDTPVDGHPAWEALPLGALHRSVEARAAWLHSRGVGPRDVVAIYATTGPDIVLTHLALARIGAIAALVNGNLDGASAAAYIRRLGAVGVLADEAHRKLLRGQHAGAPILGNIAALANGRPADAPPRYRHHGDDPIAITHSSGTTGTPKPITATHDSQFAVVRHRLRRPRAQGSQRSLSALPVPHNATLSILNFALASQDELLIMSTQGGPSTLRAIERWRPGTVLGFSVTWAELVAADLPAESVSSVRMWWNVGDCAHEAHIRRLIALGNHQVATAAGPIWELGSIFVDNFGSSELGNTVLSVIHRHGTERYGRCVGRPESYAEVAVLNPDGEELPPGQPGLLGVRTPSMSPGYWNDSVATYRSRLAGWLLTGDLVYRDADGWFYHLDRASDAVQAPDGTRLYTAMTEERVLASCPDVLDCTVVATLEGGRAVADVLLQLKPDADGSIDRRAQVRAALDERVAASVRSVEVVTGTEIPFGATGKVRKRLLRQQTRAAA